MKNESAARPTTLIKTWVVATVPWILLILFGACQEPGAAGSYLVTFSWNNGLRKAEVVPTGRDHPVSGKVRDTVVKEAEPIIATELVKANLTKADGTLSLTLVGTPPYLISSTSIQILHPNFQNLLAAVEAEDFDRISSSIASDHNVNQKELPSQDTALSIAAAGRHVRSLSKLLELGANPNIPNVDGDTPLGMAVAADCLGCVQLLLSAGAHVDHANEVGMTPLMKAADLGRDTIVEQLLQSRANARLKAKDGKTALMFARDSGHKEALTILERHN